MEPSPPSESFVTRFQQLTSGSATRRVDRELRALDLVLAAGVVLDSRVRVVAIGGAVDGAV